MIIYNAASRRAACLSDDAITTGSVGMEVRFACSEEWEGLARVAVFRGSGKSVDVLLSGDSCTVPPEVLAAPGGNLRIGLYGTDGSGHLVIPTVWADAGRILTGAAPSGVEPTPEEQTLLDQLIEELNDAQDALEEAASHIIESGITPEEREKLAGIEAGAEVNVLEEVRQYDPFRQEYVALPITDKGVDLPEIDIPTEVFYPAFTVEDDGDNLVVTSASHNPSVILNEAIRHDEAIIARVSFRGREYYLPLAEAQDNEAPYTCSFAGVIDDLEFLRITGTVVELSWTARQYLAPDANWLENELEALRDTIPETAGDVGAVAAEQGISHAGEFLVVGSDGNVTTVTMSAWTGGSY
jgi:hypothetical protein